MLFIKIIKKNDTVCGGDGLAYYVQYKGYPHYGPVPVKYEEIRPRTKTLLAFVDLDLGMDVLVNHNMETPEE